MIFSILEVEKINSQLAFTQNYLVTLLEEEKVPESIITI